MERFLNPEHMAVTGFGEAGNATLRVGDETKTALSALLGPAKRLPDWRRCEYSLGYVSSRPGDSTVALVDMSDPCLDNPDFVSGLLICSSPLELPREYRRHLKKFTPSWGIHSRLTTLSGLKLGMTSAEVEETLGKPLWQEKNVASYAALGTVLFSPEFLINRWHWSNALESITGSEEHIIRVWYTAGRVSAFLVRKLYDL